VWLAPLECRNPGKLIDRGKLTVFYCESPKDSRRSTSNLEIYRYRREGYAVVVEPDRIAVAVIRRAFF